MSVRVRKRKWPRPGAEPVLAEWDAELLGRDRYGLWLFCPAGAVHRRTGADDIVVPCDGVQLLPSTGWWVAWWWRDRRWVGADICTPPGLDRSDGAWSYTDLELDLAMLPDGTVHVVDRDEFAELVRVGSPPARVVDAAEAAADLVERSMRSAAEPFGTVGWAWLDTATG